MTLAYIGAGSNLERNKHIQAAYTELSKLGVVKPSRVFRCAPVGFDSQDFYNLVFELETELRLEELQQQLKAIEFKWGRAVDTQKYQDRSLDLDILLFGEQVSETKPILPRHDIFNYEFVLLPLFELCPDLVIPSDGRTIQQIWHSFEGKGTLTEVEFTFQ